MDALSRLYHEIQVPLEEARVDSLSPTTPGKPPRPLHLSPTEMGGVSSQRVVGGLFRLCFRPPVPLGPVECRKHFENARQKISDPLFLGPQVPPPPPRGEGVPSNPLGWVPLPRLEKKGPDESVLCGRTLLRFECVEF